jgi:hypothetical protein
VATSTVPNRGRRTVRRAPRQPALDRAWSVVLANFPPELHAPIRTYVEAQQAANKARSDLTTAKMYHPEIKWYVIDQAVRPLLAA